MEQKWTPDVLAPADNLVLPFLDEDAVADDDASSGYLRMDGGDLQTSAACSEN